MSFTDAEQWYAIEEFDRVIDADPTHRLDAYTHQLFSSNVDDFEILGGYAYQPTALTVEGLSERVHRVAVTPELLQATGIFPALGSGFSADNGLPGNNAVAIISYDLWVNTFAADEQILDQQIVIDGQAHPIVGVDRVAGRSTHQLVGVPDREVHPGQHGEGHGSPHSAVDLHEAGPAASDAELHHGQARPIERTQQRDRHVQQLRVDL
ncbi:MAG: hypothetical protein MI746_00185, partial [Pseudomonadales bacterium]|nr:hypothetical protein [Pseudomonadales bacterium]